MHTRYKAFPCAYYNHMSTTYIYKCSKTLFSPPDATINTWLGSCGRQTRRRSVVCDRQMRKSFQANMSAKLSYKKLPNRSSSYPSHMWVIILHETMKEEPISPNCTYHKSHYLQSSHTTIYNGEGVKSGFSEWNLAERVTMFTLLRYKVNPSSNASQRNTFAVHRRWDWHIVSNIPCHDCYKV